MARQRLGLQLPTKHLLTSRILGMGLMVALLVGTTGCLHHNTRGGCGGCGSGSCGSGGCSTGNCGSGDCGGCGNGSCGGSSSGLLSKARCKMANRSAGGCQTCGSGILGKIGGIAGFKCKGGNCGGCQGGSCGGCQGGSCGAGQGGACQGGNCGGCGGLGCMAGPLGWQQGGLGYSSHLTPGALGHNAGAQLNSRPFTPGPPTGQTAYPYYTTRGPRDFLSANPPSIGR